MINKSFKSIAISCFVFILIAIIVIPVIAFAESSSVLDSDSSQAKSGEPGILDALFNNNDTTCSSNADPNYLWFEPDISGDTTSVTLVKLGENAPEVDLWYSTNKTDWIQYEYEPGKSIEITTKTYFKGINTHAFYLDWENYNRIDIPEEHKAKAGGSIMSLIDGVGTSTTIEYEYCFSYFFTACKGLVKMPDLPATNLSAACYDSMFFECHNLTICSELPATHNLPDSCYDCMFMDCFALTETPNFTVESFELSGSSQLYDMFYECTSLSKVNCNLNAKELTPFCYCEMFQYCSKLVEVPIMLATDNLPKYCYENMFKGCSILQKTPDFTINSLKPNETFQCECMFEGCSLLSNITCKLNAMDLTPNCYDSMFNECLALNETPDLPAINLANYCYQLMFRNCRALQSAANLPAKNTAKCCYNKMFQGCISLAKSPAIAASATEEDCFELMFSGCANLSEVTVNFYDWNESNTHCLQWLEGVSSTGTLYGPISLQNPGSRGANTYPATWSFSTYAYVSANVSAYKGPYDGEDHGITVTGILPESPTVYYSLDGDVYQDTEITFRDTGQHLLYYKLTADGYQDTKGSAIIDIQSRDGGAVTFKSDIYTKEYGNADPIFDVEFDPEKLIEGDEPEKDVDYVITREAGETVKASGGYAVKFHWIRDNNYSFPETTTTLTINKASTNVHLVADPVSMISGGTTPTLTAHLEGLRFGEKINFAPNTDYKINVSDTNDPTTKTLTPELLEPGKTKLSNYNFGAETFIKTSILTIYEAPKASEFRYKINSYYGPYDKTPHVFSISVTAPASGAVVNYWTDAETTHTQTPKSFTDAGEYTIHYEITCEGYDTVTDVGTLTIQKASIVVAANYKEIYDGQEPPTLDATVTGLMEGESLSGTDYALTTGTISGPNTYDIIVAVNTASPSDVLKNYSATPVNSKLVVKAKEKISYKSASYSGVYDAQNHSISVTDVGLADCTIQYSEDGSIYSGDNPSYKNVTTTPKTVYYKIIPPSGNVSHEEVIGTETVSITPATLTIAAKTAVMNLGEDVPSFEAQVTGLVGSETLTPDTDYTLNGPETISGAGQYDITVSVHLTSDTAKNYNATGVPSKLVVTKKQRLNFVSEPYFGIYDGQPHSISVEVRTAAECTIEYSRNGLVYNFQNPEFCGATSEPEIVYFRITPKDSNFEVSYGQETVNIQKASATIVADAAYKIEGDKDPDFSAKTFGLIDDEEFVLGEDYKLARDPGEAPGVYEINCILAVSDVVNNYDIETASSKFFIATAPPQNPEVINGNLSSATGDNTFVIFTILFLIAVLCGVTLIACKSI